LWWEAPNHINDQHENKETDKEIEASSQPKELKEVGDTPIKEVGDK